MADLVVETRGLTKRYGSVLAVDNLSLEVPKGGVFGLLGPNGSGKTTTLGMLLGLVRPTAGSIRLFDSDGTAPHDASLRRVGAMVETPTFYPYLSGRANLRYFQGIAGRDDPTEVDRLLDQVGLSGRADSKYSTYSLGMKQRLGIAYGLLGDPELLFLDEPTNGLDPAGMAEVRDLIRDLGIAGHTVLLSSHLLHEVEQVCQHVAILSRGRLIAQGSVRELLSVEGYMRLNTTDNDKAAKIVASLDWVTDVRSDDEALVVTAPPEHSWELTAALSEHGVYVSEMAHSRVSLEQYFLDLTGE